MSLWIIYPNVSPYVPPCLMQTIIPSVPQNIFCVAGDEIWLPRRSRTWEDSWCRCPPPEFKVTEQGCSGLLFLAEVLYGTGGGWQRLDCKSWCHSPLRQNYIYTHTGILCQMVGINSCWLMAIVTSLPWSPFPKYQVKLQYQIKQTNKKISNLLFFTTLVGEMQYFLLVCLNCFFHPSTLF